jgi:cell division protein FtsQ
VTATRSRDRRVVRSQVDPKLVERRRQVSEEDRRRRRRTATVLAIVVGVVGAMIAMLFSPLLDVDRIRVEGTRSLDVEDLVAASGLAVGDRMIEVDLVEARDALRELPVVRSATVSRDWPSGLRIVVTEEEPVVELVDGERRVALSSTGRMLEGAAGGVEGLVPLQVDAIEPVAGDSTQIGDDVLAAALTIHRMNDQLRSQVASAQLSAGALSLGLTDGAAVRFGPAEDLPAKLGAVEAVLAQVDPRCRGVIDVREPSRVTVSRTCDGPAVTDTTVGSEQPEG